MNPSKTALVIQQKKATFEILHELDYKVIECNNCLDGLRKIIRYRPSLVISKVDTEHLNGVSMANIMNMFRVQSPIIFTALSETHREKAIAMDNVVGFIPVAGIQTLLKKTIQKGLENFRKSYPKYSYTLREREWSDLMAISDHRQRILLVEDSKMARRRSLTLLDSDEEYELYSAHNGFDGILKAMLVKPDLIITDIDMPILNGMAMAEIFYIINKPIPIVFLTGIKNPKILRKAKKIDGVIGYMDKDLLQDKELFLQEVQKHLIVAQAKKSSLQETYLEASIEKLDSKDLETATAELEGSKSPSLGSSLTLGDKSRSRVLKGHGAGLGGFWES